MNNFAISSGGIGVALEKSASALSTANNTLDESIAMITASNSVVQNEDVVGTAMKTIALRIRGAKTELEKAQLDTEGMASSTAKLREEIKALSGVDIMLDEQTFKSTYQIMDELAIKWKDLSDIARATILEDIAGKRQSNVGAALLENFDIARNALQTSLDSEGSAMAEYNKWLESMEGHIQQLKLSWQSLSQTLLSSDGLINGIDLLTNFLNILTKLIDTFGTVPTVVGVATAAMSFKNVGELINQFLC